MKKLLIAIFIFCGIAATAQVYTPPNPTVFGQNVNRLRPKFVLHVPRSASLDLNTTDTTPQLRVVDDILYIYLAGTWFEVGSGGSSKCPPTFAELQGFLEENVNAQASLLAKQDLIPYGNNPDLIVDTFERYWNGYHEWPRLDSGVYKVFGIVESSLGVVPYYTWQANSNILLSRANIDNLDSINYIGGQFFYGGGTLGTKPTSNSNGIILAFGQNVNNLVSTTNQAYQWSVDGNGAFSARIKPAASGTWGAWVRPIYAVDLEHYLYDTGATVLGRLNAQSFRVGDAVTPTTTFNVVNTNTATLRGAALYQYSTGTNSSQLNMLKYRGTVASPTVIVTADVISNIMSWGYDGTNPVNTASIRVNSIGTIATGIVPSTMDFRTMTAAGVLTTGLNIDQAQKVTIGGDLSIGGNQLISGTVNKLTITPPTTGSTLRVRDGKTLDVVNTVTFSGTDGSTLAYRTGGTIIYSTDVMTASVGGLTPTPPNDATKFLSGAGTYILPFTSVNVGNGLKLDSAKVKWGGTMYENMVLDAAQKNVSIVNIGNGTWQSSDGVSASLLVTNTGYAGLSNYDVNNLTTFTVGNTDVGGVNGAQISASNISGSKNMVMTLFDSVLAIKYVVSSSPTSIFKMNSDGKTFFTNTVQIVDGTQGSGKVFTSDGSGNGSWVTPASGGSVTSVSFTGGLISVATPTTTPALTVAGTSGGVPYFSSSSTWGSSGALAANAILIGGGAGAAPSSTTTGTGVLTALGVNTGSAGSFVVNGGALGTPASGVGTNFTGTASGLTAGSATALATPRTIGTVTGDATSAGSSFDGTGNNTNSITVTKINGTAFSGLATGILKNTTSTGVPSIAVAADFPTLNQNTTGSAASLTTPRTITATSDIAWTITFDGTANATAAATIANSAITTAKMANWSSHTHWVNNGGSAAAPVETPYYQAKNVTYDGTATWDGTTPTTATITYDLIRDGIWVTLIIHGDYTGAGATNTQLTLTLPSAAPTPTGPTGRTSANNRQYAGFGGFATAKTANWATNNKVWVQLNGSSVPIILVVGNSTSAASFDATVVYMTNLPS